MASPFDSPTVRPSDPITHALGPEQRTARLPSPPPSSSSRPISPPMRTYDTPNSRFSTRPSQSRQSSFVSAREKPNSIHSSAPGVAKTSKSQPKRAFNDRTKRNSLADTASVMSGPYLGGARQPQVQDFQGPTPEELVRFAALCRKQYYDGDNQAARKVGEILAKLAPPSVAVYSRTMAGVRSEYHRDKEIERRLHVETTLAAILPGSTIKQALGVPLEDGLGGGLSAMRSSKARKARSSAFKEFLSTNCVKQVPGCHPFFRSLFAALWLQSIEPARGGAGARRVEWEVDVNVFTEAGGGASWTREAVEALKGVLGMSERIKEPQHTDTFRSSVTTASTEPPLLDPTSPLSTSSDAAIEPRSFPEEHGMLTTDTAGSKKQPPAVPPHRSSLRNRSPSDPFCDPGSKLEISLSPAPALPSREPPSSPGLDVASPDLASTTCSTPLLASPITSLEEKTPAISATTLSAPRPSLDRSRSSQSAPAVAPQFRTFTLPPYLTNPELRALCRLFPEFISTPARTGARFRSSSISSTDRTKAQTDAGVNAGAAGPTRVGHGDLRIGNEQRDAGWRGTLWERIIAWFKAWFG
ncbi:hypothetical protein JCM11491_003446 [Sporobolomyces phaffii]